jgi:hypothetical protein
MKQKIWAVMALLGIGMGAAQAATQSVQGAFLQDDELFSTSVWLSQDDQLSVQTFSFAGGLNGQGQPIAAGGFAPVLALFAEGGELLQLARGSSGACGDPSSPDPASGFCWDAGFSMALPAGHYTLVLSQDGNEPLGPLLGDGYSQAGTPDYTGLNYLGQPGLHFVQVDASQRSGLWAFDVQAASVPEPASALLWLLGATGLIVARRRQQGA